VENAPSAGNAAVGGASTDGTSGQGGVRSAARSGETIAGTTTGTATHGDVLSARQSYDLLLKSELLDVDTCEATGKHLFLAAAASTLDLSKGAGRTGSSLPSGGGMVTNPTPLTSVGGSNIFRFRTAPAEYGGGADESSGCASAGGGLTCSSASGLNGGVGGAGLGEPDFRRFSIGGGGRDPATAAALAALSSKTRRARRKISLSPFKVLDAPALTDDFYLNLVDWSVDNVLAVGLGCCVYLWSACTSLVTKLCEVDGPVCSVAWSLRGKELAIGTPSGVVQVWDAVSCTMIRELTGHTSRTGCLAWNSSLLSSGSRDKNIFNRDMRAPESYIARLSGHDHEICGLKWSPDDMQLASGGNDNQLLIWSSASIGGAGSFRRGNSSSLGNGRMPLVVNACEPLLRFTLHEAAVKAIAWSPHARGLLASGGGTADRTIRFWNTVTDNALAAVDTGSQVCNLAWSKNVNEIVSTHGYSQNQIIVWRYPSLSKVVTLTGHTQRVLYLAVSPTGETIVTGCGDETLRFWNLFPSAANSQHSTKGSVLSPERMHIR
jgi:cell division cycle 20-like protein 1, cofactor of APC complex